MLYDLTLKKEKTFDEIAMDFSVSIDTAEFRMKYSIGLEADTPPIIIGNGQPDPDKVAREHTQEEWNKTIESARNLVESSTKEIDELHKECISQIRESVKDSREFAKNNNNHIAEIDKKFRSNGIIPVVKSSVLSYVNCGMNIPTLTSKIITDHLNVFNDLANKGTVSSVLSDSAKLYIEKIIECNKYKEPEMRDYKITKKDWEFSRNIYTKDYEQDFDKAHDMLKAFHEKICKDIQICCTSLVTKSIRATSANAGKDEKRELTVEGNNLKRKVKILNDLMCAYRYVKDLAIDSYTFAKTSVEKNSVDNDTHVDEIAKSVKE